VTLSSSSPAIPSKLTTVQTGCPFDFTKTDAPTAVCVTRDQNPEIPLDAEAEPSFAAAKQLKRISIEDTYQKLEPGSDALKSTINAALNTRELIKTYQSNIPEDKVRVLVVARGRPTRLRAACQQQPAAADIKHSMFEPCCTTLSYLCALQVTPTNTGTTLLALGKFQIQDVVHIDVSDKGCKSNVGISYNVVGRWGTKQYGNAPEAFFFGTANSIPSSKIALYWIHDDTENGYYLYVGVKNFPSECKAGGKALDAADHTLTVRVRSSNSLKPDDKSPCTALDCVGLEPLPQISIEDAHTKTAATGASTVDLIEPKTVDFSTAVAAQFKTSDSRLLSAKLTDTALLNTKRLRVEYVANLPRGDDDWVSAWLPLTVV